MPLSHVACVDRGILVCYPLYDLVAFLLPTNSSCPSTKHSACPTACAWLWRASTYGLPSHSCLSLLCHPPSTLSPSFPLRPHCHLQGCLLPMPNISAPYFFSDLVYSLAWADSGSCSFHHYKQTPCRQQNNKTQHTQGRHGTVHACLSCICYTGTI